jgi:hypothetical protein
MKSRRGSGDAANVCSVSRAQQAHKELVYTIRKAAGVCDVTPPVVRRWIKLGWLPKPPWTLEQLNRLRDTTDSPGRRRGPGAAHGTPSRWLEGCDCDPCRLAMNAAAKTRSRAKAKARLPVEVRRQLLEAIYTGTPFRAALHGLGLTSNQVWGLTQTDAEWSEALDAALTATRRDDLEHGTNAAYMAGCVCKDCREHQRIRMAKKPGLWGGV